MLIRSVVAVAASLVVTSAAETTPATKAPHIVSIIADDLGYFDAGILGNEQVTTPNMDVLIKGGMRLTHHYAYKYCSPSRRAFVSGRWPLHLGEANQNGDIDLRMATLANKLDSVGYETTLVGKTHWNGKTTHHLPFYRGWQNHVGYLGGGEAYWSGHECIKEGVNCHDFSDQFDFWHNDGPASKELLGQYSTDLFSRLAVEAIEKNNNSVPLWLHLNYQSVHNPQTSPPGQPTLDDNADLVFLENLKRMDEGIGNVTAALKRKGMWEKTILLFFSDNGGADLGNNYPLRGGKYKPFEGGLRTMAFLNGGFLPSHVAGTTFHGLIHISDWYPTFCKLAGAPSEDDPPSDDPQEWFYPVDGLDVWPYLTGGADPRNGSQPIVLSSLETSGPGGGALIAGRYKIVIDAQNNGWDQPPTPGSNKTSPSLSGNNTCVDGSKSRGCKICTLAKPCLYDVWSDDSEVHNLAKAMPKLVNAMNRTFAKLVFERRLPAPLNFTKENGWDCKTKWGSFSGPQCSCTRSQEKCSITSGVSATMTVV